MVLIDSTGIARAPAYSGNLPESIAFRLQGCHPLWPTFPGRSTLFHKSTGLVPVRSPLLRESRLLYFPPATKMFQFAGLPRHDYGFIVPYQAFNLVGCPIRKPRDHRLLTASPGLSRSTASFFGCWCQGIPRVPFVA